MTAAQDNRFTAYDNLHQALTLDSAPYQEDEALKDIVSELGLGLNGLRVLRKNKTRPNSGPAADKNTAKQFLADVSAEVAGDLFEWATKNKDTKLQAAADYNSSDLFKLRGTRIFDVTGHILQQAYDQKAAMGKYAISDARTQELADARSSFDGLRTGSRQQQTQRIGISKTIGERFSSLATIVQDRFERSMRKYKRSNREFYDRVMAAREVIDLPGTHESPTPPAA